MSDAIAFYVRLFSAVIYGLACAYIGYQLGDSVEAPEVTTPAPAREQPDGSLILERDPAPARQPPPHAIPAGHVEERRVLVRVQPNTTAAKAASKVTDGETDCTCDPVDLTLSLVRDDAGGRRAIASMRNGRVIGGLDVPIVAPSVFANSKWAAGVGYDVLNEAVGVRVDRDFAHNDAMVGDFDGDGRREDTAVRAWALWRFGG
jgi:hypothetical protein